MKLSSINSALKSIKIYNKLTHIPRFINAEKILAIKFTLKSLLFMFLFVLLISNFPTASFNSAQQKAKIEILKNPKNINIYKNAVHETMKHKEYRLAGYLTRLSLLYEPHNLDFLELEDLIYLKQNAKKIIELQISNWQKIAKAFPDYRDAHARLAYLNLEMGNREDAKKYLKVVRSINPNWPLLKKFPAMEQ